MVTVKEFLFYFQVLMPDRFNPAYGPYGHGAWPGHPALNAFNGSCCDPFTGYIPVDNYITDCEPLSITCVGILLNSAQCKVRRWRPYSTIRATR